MKPIFALPALALLSACVTYQDAPIVEGTVQPEGSAVALRQHVAVADVVLTPMEVTEDSRCPINARCVWAGEITVTTRIDGAGWRETVPMTLGEAMFVRGYRLSLVSAEPGRVAGEDGPEPGEYRFVYEGGSSGIVAK